MSIDKSPGTNEVLFAWINHYAGVTVKTPSKTIVVDPVDVKAKNFKSIDAVLVTHEHYDHLDQALVTDMQKQTGCMVVADATSARRLRNAIPSDSLTVAEPGIEAKVGDVTVKAERCNHPPAATPVTLLITSEDGVKVYHTADSLPFPELVDIGEKEKIDVVFCTVGIAPGASPNTGVDIARLTRPKVAVPYHTGQAEDQRKFAEILKRELPRVTCLLPEVGKIYQISKKV